MTTAEPSRRSLQLQRIIFLAALGFSDSDISRLMNLRANQVYIRRLQAGKDTVSGNLPINLVSAIVVHIEKGTFKSYAEPSRELEILQALERLHHGVNQLINDPLDADEIAILCDLVRHYLLYAAQIPSQLQNTGPLASIQQKSGLAQLLPIIAAATLTEQLSSQHIASSPATPPSLPFLARSGQRQNRH